MTLKALWNSPAGQYVRAVLGALIVVLILATALNNARSDELCADQRLSVAYAQRLAKQAGDRFTFEFYKDKDKDALLHIFIHELGMKDKGINIPEPDEMDTVVAMVDAEDKDVIVAFAKGDCTLSFIPQPAPIEVWLKIVAKLRETI